MKILYNDRTYTINSYDLKNGICTTTNGLELKEEDIHAFILPLEEYKKIKYGRFTKTSNTKATSKKVIDKQAKEENSTENKE